MKGRLAGIGLWTHQGDDLVDVVVQCSPAEAAGALPLLGKTVEVAGTSGTPPRPPAKTPGPADPPDMRPHVCPCCGRTCFVAEVAHPQRVVLLVDGGEDAVVPAGGGRLQVVMAFRPHALSCPDWPVETPRDWRQFLDGAPNQGDEHE